MPSAPANALVALDTALDGRHSDLLGHGQGGGGMPHRGQLDLFKNRLYCGDNLDVLRDLPSDWVDLIYLDPPFNSKADYNVLFKEKDGSDSMGQRLAFGDTWRWSIETEALYQEVVTHGPPRVGALLAALREVFGGKSSGNDILAYLVMMAARLVEMHRVLAPTGSLYLHCDPTASHYLKVVLDAVFGGPNFVNEICWKRTTTKNDFAEGAKNWPRVHDVLLLYAKDARRLATYNQQFADYDEEYVRKKYPYVDEDGRKFGLWDLTAPGAGSRGHPQYEFMGVTRYWRYNRGKMETLAAQGRVVQPSPGRVPRYKRYFDEVQGIAVGDFWGDISPINSQAQERLGYPTQKPEALLERILHAGSNEGDLVLDPFCGCGTTVAAAQRLNRRWIGIDITHLAIGVIRGRLRSSGVDDATYEVFGDPKDLASAESLAALDPFEFERWALGLVGVRVSYGSQKRGADRGVDGHIHFLEGTKRKSIVVQVKSGKVHPSHIRDLRGVLERDKAPIAVFITLRKPTEQMVTEAASCGFYQSAATGRKYPRLQILTVEELLGGRGVDCPVGELLPLRQHPSQPLLADLSHQRS